MLQIVQKYVSFLHVNFYNTRNCKRIVKLNKMQESYFIKQYLRNIIKIIEGGK